MAYSFINDFFEYLNNNFNGQIPNLIFFAIGLGIGIVLFLLTFLIVYIISKTKNKEKKNKEIIVNAEYKSVILASKDIYLSSYKNAPLMEKLQGIGKISLNMLEDISALYYPESNDSMFEISIDQLVEFLSYFSARINYIIDKLLEGKLQIADAFTNYTIKEKKLSFVIDLIEKNKDKKFIEQPEKQKKGLFSFIKNKAISIGKKIAFKATEYIIDEEILDLIESFGEDINKLYSKQELLFTDLTKKQLKMQKRLNRIAKKELKRQGDVNV